MLQKHPRSATAFLLLVLLSSACRTLPDNTNPQSDLTAAWISDTLYLGASIPGGGEVSPSEWRVFIDEVVTPAFPEGFTSYEADGQWKGADGQIVTERSHVLLVVHEETETREASIQRIIDEYKRRFRQESVLRVRSRVRVDFE